MLNPQKFFFSRHALRRRGVALAASITGTWWILSALFFAAPNTPKWADRAVTSTQRADAVKSVFKSAWEGYYKHAFPEDELHPFFNTYGNSRCVTRVSLRFNAKNTRNGWGATAVDALGTAILMDDQETVDQILDFIPSINFQKTSTAVDLFETTIRYLGGMLSAYDLLNGPMHHLVREVLL
jgi:mannosyl-oligosaccharide alpha-1,2-mannosidase